MKRLILLLVVVAVTAAACSSGGGDQDESGFLPIEDILTSEVVITPDSSGTTATLEVDTSIPVACAVIYGTDASFGQLAVDNDMQGGAHENHGPLMTGLEPDTEYQYILQGSDTQGNVYRSDVMTFRTPPAAANALGENIATDATVTGFSSEFSDSFAASLAIDGNRGTEWSSAGDGDDAWIEIDLGEPRSITGVAFKTRSMSDGTAITETFTVTVDGTSYGPFPAGDQEAVFDSPVTGQVIRFDAETTTGGNTGASEVEVYAG